MKKGFTLIEVLIIIAIVGIMLVVIFGPTKSHKKSNQPVSTHNVTKVEASDNSRIQIQATDEDDEVVYTIVRDKTSGKEFLVVRNKYNRAAIAVIAFSY